MSTRPLIVAVVISFLYVIVWCWYEQDTIVVPPIPFYGEFMIIFAGMPSPWSYCIKICYTRVVAIP